MTPIIALLIFLVGLGLGYMAGMERGIASTFTDDEDDNIEW